MSNVRKYSAEHGYHQGLLNKADLNSQLSGWAANASMGVLRMRTRPCPLYLNGKARFIDQEPAYYPEIIKGNAYPLLIPVETFNSGNVNFILYSNDVALNGYKVGANGTYNIYAAWKLGVTSDYEVYDVSLQLWKNGNYYSELDKRLMYHPGGTEPDYWFPFAFVGGEDAIELTIDDYIQIRLLWTGGGTAPYDVFGTDVSHNGYVKMNYEGRAA